MKCGDSDRRNIDYDVNCTPEKFFRRLIPQDTPLIVDVGAHTGESVMFFKSIFPGARIYSVEPDPESFAMLLQNCPDVTRAFNLAVHSQSGKATFFQYKDNSHLNSLYPLNRASVDSLGYVKRAQENQVEVRVLTLDDLVFELDIGSKRINLLKIDVQGAEVDVLSGAKSMLKIVDNITLELGFDTPLDY